MHRDLKPDNILFRNLGDDECVIADFGLGEYAHTKEYLYSRCGTPGYVAPEVANLKNPTEKYTVACDMFSLGVIFHILALRKTPFEGRSYNQILIKNRNCQIDFNESCYKQIP
jgi:serine/threonine protein kinase